MICFSPAIICFSPQLREVLEKFLDDDSDMKDMNLTAKQQVGYGANVWAVAQAGGCGGAGGA